MHLPEIVIASGNRHKFEEFQSLLISSGTKLLFGGDLLELDVDESGSSFLENATIKAREWAKNTKLPCLADDSGLEVEALEWRPGIFSARIGETDEARRDLVLKELQGFDNRRARYAAALVLVSPDGEVLWSVVSYCWGKIVDVVRGHNGFGYDPIFAPEGYDKTFGELDPTIKSKLSHRSKASKEFLKWLVDDKNMVQ